PATGRPSTRCVRLPLHLFFFHAPPSAPLHTLSLHDALPISETIIDNQLETITPYIDTSSFEDAENPLPFVVNNTSGYQRSGVVTDRKSTRLNSSHVSSSYAVFCLKKKKRQPSTKVRRRARP